MNCYEKELYRQILSLPIAEKLTSMLSLAASSGFSLDTREDVESLAECLADTLAKEFTEGGDGG